MAAPHDLQPQREQPVILLADDEASVLDFARLTLQRAGYIILVACDREEALRISRTFPGEIHALVSDVMMPKLNGIALREKILMERPGIRVLLMSGTMKESAFPGIDFLPKPFQIDELKRRVQALFAKTGSA